MEENEENAALAIKIRTKLLSALGTDGMLILDNEVEFLIDLINGYLHFECDVNED